MVLDMARPKYKKSTIWLGMLGRDAQRSGVVAQRDCTKLKEKRHGAHPSRFNCWLWETSFETRKQTYEQ